jgi:hypothetical protein
MCEFPEPTVYRSFWCALLVFGGLLFSGCRQREDASMTLPPVAVHAKAVDDLNYLSGHAIGAPVVGRPWVAHVTAVDLDHDSKMDAVL